MRSEVPIEQERARLHIHHPWRFPWVAKEDISLPEGKTLIPVGRRLRELLSSEDGVSAACLADAHGYHLVPTYEVEGVGECVALEHLNWLREAALTYVESHRFYDGNHGWEESCDPACSARVSVCMLRNGPCLSTQPSRGLFDASSEVSDG